MTEYITRKDKKEDKPQYITLRGKKQKPFITKKSPEEIRERGMTEKASGGRIGLRGGGICKRGMNRKAIGKNS